MKIRALQLINVRRFAGQSARIEGIGDGITVLCEPNEFGKSTFFDALHALFFERHRATRSTVKALQPHSGGAPEVAADLDLPDGRYRVEKRWLSRASAKVSRDGRTLAQDDEAEAWIDRMLGAGLSGPSGLLWVRQGLLGLEPEGSSASDKSDRERALSARRDLLSSVAGEIEMMTGGRRLDAVVARVADALGRLATATGRPKAGGEWARAEAEADALRAEEAELAAKAARLSDDLSRRGEAQRQLAVLDDPGEEQRRAEVLAAARAALAEAEAHADRLGAAQRTLALARATDDNARAEIERLETLSDRAARAAQALAAATEDATRHDARMASLSPADRDATAALRDTEARTRALRDRLGLAQRARLARAAQDRAEHLARSLAEAERLRADIEAQRARRGLLLVTPQALAAAEQASDELNRAEARLAAQSVSLSLAYTGAARVRAGGADLPEGLHHLTGPRDFDLPGIGTMRIDPGTQTGGDRTQRDRAAATLTQRLSACGAEDLGQARARLVKAQRLDDSLRGAQALLAQLAPDGLDALRQAHAQAAAEAGAVSDEAEDPAALEARLAAAVTAEDEARAAAAEAQAALRAASEARAGATATLAAARRAHDAAAAEAGDPAALTARLRELRDARTGHQSRLSDAQADCARLERAAPDLDMARAALSRAQSVAAQAKAQRDRLREDLAMLNGSIGTLAEEGIEERLDEVRGRLTDAEARAARYAAEVRSLTRLRQALDEARRQARDAYLGPVMRELQPLLSVIHPGATLEIDDQTLLPAVLTRHGQAEALDILSGGTREQVAILTRLAFARLFARAGTQVPVILDDALVHSDDDRIEAMFTALHRVAQDQQILVLTCRQRAFAA
uniref:AAA family ATPase n=1 Tax=Paracoccus sp. TaxID=267 RepID=UPI0035B37A66